MNVHRREIDITYVYPINARTRLRLMRGGRSVWAVIALRRYPPPLPSNDGRGSSRRGANSFHHV
jgi:hypothetical protein